MKIDFTITNQTIKREWFIWGAGGDSAQLGGCDWNAGVLACRSAKHEKALMIRQSEVSVANGLDRGHPFLRVRNTKRPRGAWISEV